MKIEAGMEFDVPYPFVLEDYQGMDEDGPFTSKSWRPGVRFENVYPDDSESVADALGRMILTVVGTFKPGRFPERVFFTRLWRDPTGREFGKSKLHIATAQKFRRLSRGYMHEYRSLEMIAA